MQQPYWSTRALEIRESYSRARLTSGPDPPPARLQPIAGIRTCGARIRADFVSRCDNQVTPYVELHCHSAYSFLDGASRPEELVLAAAGARLPGARAHGPRRGLRIARVRLRGQGVRPPLDHRRRGHAGLRLPRDPARRDSARLRQPLPPPHRRARGAAARSAPRPDAARGGERGARLPLRLRAPRPRRPQPERSRAPRARLRHRPLLRRAAASAPARGRPPERGPARPRRGARRPYGGDRQRPCPRGEPRAAPGRPRRGPNRTSLEGCEPERRGNDECALLPPAEVVARWPDDRERCHANGRARRAARVRPDRGARLPLPGLLGRGGSGRRPARPRHAPRVRRAVPPCAARAARPCGPAPARGARAHRRARPLGVLPPPLGGARARP